MTLTEAAVQSQEDTGSAPSRHSRPASDKGNESNSHSFQRRGIRFWLILTALGVSGLLVALEATMVSTALPSIIDELDGAELYVWVVMAFFLTS